LSVYQCAAIQELNVRNLMTAQTTVCVHLCTLLQIQISLLLPAEGWTAAGFEISYCADSRHANYETRWDRCKNSIFTRPPFFFGAQIRSLQHPYNATIVTNCSFPLSISRPRRAAALGRAAPRRARLLSSAIRLGSVICNAVLDLGLSSTVSNSMRLPGRSRSITSLATTIPLTKPLDERASASLLPFSSPETHQTKIQQCRTDINEASCSSLKLALDAQIHTFRIGLVPN